ncbi:MAG: DedA family protein [Candidatus Eremiobacteraeota bacterium]|nr:DedA family protein [Candidatus Eremiobacteraeota bacterium]
MVAQKIVEWCTGVIHSGGYWGAGFLMALESMIAPIPSEAVMPPVGILVKKGAFNAGFAILATSMGSIVGSLISYYMGYYGGRPLVLRVGKYLLLDNEHLEWTEKWFRRHGFATIFIGRFIPVVRHLISIPAGLGKMPILPFAAYTLVGATIWNSFLLYVGYKFATYESQIWEISHRFHLDGIVAAMLVFIVLFLVIKHMQKGKKAARASQGD